MAKKGHRTDQQGGQKHAKGIRQGTIWEFGQNGWEPPNYPVECGRSTDSDLRDNDRGGKGEDNVNRPSHYNQLKGFEAIDITEQFNFNLGNAIKYIIRCDHKGKPIEDIRKSIWYLERELDRRYYDGEA